MSYFVAEDRFHDRLGSAMFISRCGYEYPPLAVSWAGDYEPEAYAPCEGCRSSVQGSGHEEPVIVQGVYAVDDHAHLWIRRSPETWHSVCGRDDKDFLVAWADDKWPEAYNACSKCVELVDADLWEPEVSDTDTPDLSPLDPCRTHRVWVIQDNVEHRARDRSLSVTMCGAAFLAEVTPRFKPTRGMPHCYACDQAVGHARAGLPVEPPLTGLTFQPSTPQPTGRTAPTSPLPNRRRPTASTSRSSAAPPQQRRQAGRKPKPDSDEALFGRKMIVPIRFVRGGAPGLGRRR